MVRRPEVSRKVVVALMAVVAVVAAGVIVCCAPFSTEEPASSSGATPSEAGSDGALGSEVHPAPSCKAILVASPGIAGGAYFVQPNPSDSSSRFKTHCDMTTEGGGWTQVTADVNAANVTLLLGGSGRQMLKCTADGTSHVISPSFTTPWQWNASKVQIVAGTWIANGASVSCGSDTEFSGVRCSTFWGVGCDNGTGASVVKVIPGVIDVKSAHTCADSTSAHTRAAVSLCGDDEFRQYAAFVRAD